jgi:preprotein translocase subunit Sec61beta
MDELKQASERPASFAQTIKAVLWSFFGVRRRADHESDVTKLNPVHVVIAGLIVAALFVVTLLMVVRWVVAK